MPVARAPATSGALLAGCAGFAAPAVAGHVCVGFGIGVPGIAAPDTRHGPTAAPSCTASGATERQA